MRGRILFVVGLGVGYVFGTRAGRARYHQMKDAALKVWNDPRVQEQVSAATEFVRENAPEVAAAVQANVERIAKRVESARGGAKPAAKPATKTAARPATKPATKPAAKPATRTPAAGSSAK